MTAFFWGFLVGAVVGFGGALIYNHKNAKGFDELTDKADRKVDELRKK